MKNFRLGVWGYIRIYPHEKNAGIFGSFEFSSYIRGVIKNKVLCHLTKNFFFRVGDGFLTLSTVLIRDFFLTLRKNLRFLSKWSAIRPFFIFVLLLIILWKLFLVSLVLFGVISTSYEKACPFVGYCSSVSFCCWCLLASCSW